MWDHQSKRVVDDLAFTEMEFQPRRRSRTLDVSTGIDVDPREVQPNPQQGTRCEDVPPTTGYVCQHFQPSTPTVFIVVRGLFHSTRNNSSSARGHHDVLQGVYAGSQEQNQAIVA